MGGKLDRPGRRATLVVHVAACVAWLGLPLGPLALGITATTTGFAAVVEASVRARCGQRPRTDARTAVGAGRVRRAA